MKGAPLRQTAQLSGLDLLYDPAHPSQFGLPQHQLVLRLYEEKARQVPLLHGSIETRSHLPSLTFQSPHPLLQKRDSLLGRKRGQKREPGRKLRVLLDRLPHKLTQPGKELLASQAGYLIDRPFGTSPLAYRLPRHDEPLPLQRRHHRVKRAVPEPHRFVLAPLAHQRNHLVRVHRPLVEKRHHRQSQRIGYLPLRRHQNSFSRYKLVEIDYTLGLAWCQAERELPSYPARPVWAKAEIHCTRISAPPIFRDLFDYARGLFSCEHDEVVAHRGERLTLEAAVDRLYLEARELQHQLQLTASDDADGEVVGSPALQRARGAVSFIEQAHLHELCGRVVVGD